MNLDIFSYEKNIKNYNNFYAHTKKIKNELNKVLPIKEKLIDHSKKTIEYLHKIIEIKNMDEIFNKIFNKIFKSNKYNDFCKELLINSIFLHDLGKANPAFQYEKMDEKSFKSESENMSDSFHSQRSATLYFAYYSMIIENNFKEVPPKDKFALNIILAINSISMLKHHGNLNSFSYAIQKMINYLDEMLKNNFFKNLFPEIGNNSEKYINEYNKLLKNINNYYTKFTQNTEIFYIYQRLAYGLLVQSDYFATTDFMSNRKINDFGLINEDMKIFNKYKNSLIYKQIQSYKDGHINIKKIDKLRNDIFLDAENELLKNIDKSNIFFLEAPTGSGKTNISLNLAFNIISKRKTYNKINYIFPFNTLAEQTYNSIAKSFNNDEEIMKYIAIVNSITAPKNKEENDNESLTIDFEKIFIDREFFHYPITLTSNIALFKILFGTKKSDLFSLSYLANSVIILDEIQSYKNSIWAEIFKLLESYAEILNIKFIIMSATLPSLDELTNNVNVIRLIKNPEKYYNEPEFKKRVSFDFSMLDKDYSNELLLNKINEAITKKNKILVEFITKKSAKEFYNLIKDKYKDTNIITYLLTGDDNKYTKEKIINLIKTIKTQKIILVCTQVVEAGVDISMDIGFKNISILDSEEQFAGRINRSFDTNDAKVYFFKKDEPKSVYSKDYRSDKKNTIINEDIRSILINKNFKEYYSEKIIEELRKRKNENSYRKFEEYVKNLDYEEIKKHMELIPKKENEITIFLNRDIKFKNNLIHGNDIWNEYKEILTNTNLTYPEKQVKLMNLKEKMNLFLYKIENNANIPSYSEFFGNIFYYENGKEYIDEDIEIDNIEIPGKLDESKFLSYSELI